MNLVAYLVYPLSDPLEIPRGVITAILVPIVVGGVWLTVRRIRRAVE
jgi:uncharacterized membrane-anchored protein